MRPLPNGWTLNQLPKAQRPKTRRIEAAFFTDAELPPLFEQLRRADRALFLTALKTGMRRGELLALTWGSVDLAEQVIGERRHYVAGVGIVEGAKSEEGRRDVLIPAELVDALGAHWSEQRRPGDDALVSQGRTASVTARA